MAEELTKYLSRIQIRCRYIHSDVDTLERVEIMRDLRLGIFDVLIGVNLLREGLDLPEVSLVAILDADKEGFLRSHRSLTQTIGRAARNINGIAIMYADKMTNSMQLTIDETNRRREKQVAYNIANNITPTQITKSIENIMGQNTASTYNFENLANIAAEEKMDYMTKAELENSIREKRKLMEEAAKALDFIAAAKLRDTIKKLKERI
jgi:excinuclease ABC subunit B